MDYHRYDGWTLVEVLTAMTIVFVLTGTVGHIGYQQVDRARQLAAEQEVSAITVALETYAFDCGTYPTEAQGLDALWEAPVLHPVPEAWDGPYLTEPVGTTPWGTPYRYRVPGSNGRPYEITFSGETE